MDHGLVFLDKALLPVLLDDAQKLHSCLCDTPGIVETKYFMRCAYTPLYGVTLLHICAEFNHVACAEVLLSHGADVNTKADLDEYGFGGQTPIFHTVNQNSNSSLDILHFLLSKSADLKSTTKGIVWGNSYPWKTLIPAVNPISYAMMGLLPQMHRDESAILQVVSLLLKSAYGIEYKHTNFPNKYLNN